MASTASPQARKRSFYEEYSQNFYQKCVKRNKFPYKFVIHLLLIVAVTAKVMVTLLEDGSYARSMSRTYRYLFFPPSYAFTDGNYAYLYTINDTLGLVEQSILRYNSINNFTTTKLQYVDMDGNCIKNTSNTADRKPLELNVVSYTTATGTKTETYSLYTSSDLDVITSDTAAFFNNLKFFDLRFHVCNSVRRSLFDQCYKWSVSSGYSFIKGVVIRVQMSDQMSLSCSSMSFSTYIGKRDHFLNVIIFLLAALYLVILIRSMALSIILYTKAKAAHQKSRNRDRYSLASYAVTRLEWNEIPLQTKKRFFQSFVLVAVLGCVFAFVDAAYSISTQTKGVNASINRQIPISAAALLLWVSFSRYIVTLHESFGGFVNTVPTAMYRISPFLVAALMALMAFSLAGMAGFGDKVSYFVSFRSTLQTLFAVMNGDTVLNLFTALGSSFGSVGVLYVSVFLLCFTYVVINIIIAFVESSYFASRDKTRKLDEFFSKYLQKEAWALDVEDSSSSSDDDDDSANENDATRLSPARSPKSKFVEWTKARKDRIGKMKRHRSPTDVERKHQLNSVDEMAEVVLLGEANWVYNMMVDAMVDQATVEHELLGLIRVDRLQP